MNAARVAGRIESERMFQLVCAWCGYVVRSGAAPVTHGICSACQAEFERACANLLERTAR